MTQVSTELHPEPADPAVIPDCPSWCRLPAGHGYASLTADLLGVTRDHDSDPHCCSRPFCRGLKEAGAAGATRVRAKMADAVALAKLSGVEAVNWSLGHAAVYGRFAERDLASILRHRAAGGTQATARASEDHSLQAGTDAWKQFGR